MLRPYQQKLVDEIAAAFKSGAGSVCMQMATGGGKTHTASAMLKRMAETGRRGAFLAHLDTLVEDTHEKLTAQGIHTGFVQAGRVADPTAPIQVATIQTLHARDELPPAHFVFDDECHRSMSPTRRAILATYRARGAVILGGTATPQRGDGQALGEEYQRMVRGPSMRWLTDSGDLVPCEVVGPTSDGAIAMDPVAAYEQYAPGTRAIVFASTVDQATELASRFPLSALITGDTPSDERKAAFAAVKARTKRVLVSVNVFIEGFDLPCIETVILARPFGVVGSFLQAIGRGLRPSPTTFKMRCLVIDLCGSTILHGLPDEDRTWSLTGDASHRAERLPSIQHCQECLAMFRPAAHCPRCGALTKYSASHIRRIETREEKLEKLSALPESHRDALYLESLRLVAATRFRLRGGAAHAWAVRTFIQKRGRRPAA